MSVQVYASVSAVCHAMRRNRWDKGFAIKLLEFLVLAALASCPWLRRRAASDTIFASSDV